MAKEQQNSFSEFISKNVAGFIAGSLLTSLLAIGGVVAISTGLIPIPGSTGPQGVPGLCGLPGQDGQDGACGPVGATGPCGPVGATGAQGEQGEPGPQGSPGPTGATGAQGEQGETGPQGSPGPTGAPGAQGEQGETGATGPAGADGVSIIGHWGSFWDTEDQANTLAVVRAMRINAAHPDNCGVYTDESDTKIYVTRAGVYNLQFSAQIKTTKDNTHPVDIWLAKNGEAVPDSNTQFFTPSRKGIYIAAWNFVIPMAEGDYLELMWYSLDTNLYIAQLDEQVALGIPAVPSLILTLTQVGGETLPLLAPSPLSEEPDESPSPSDSPEAEVSPSPSSSPSP